jgi:hypothetical protein
MSQIASSKVNPPPDVHLWMPPGRMQQYHLARAIGGTLAAVIFVGWLLIQWSNPVMRLFACALVVMTAWITVQAIAADIRRSRGRQISLSGGVMTVTTQADQNCVALADVVLAQWHDEPAEKIGLWLIDDQDNVLAHLDERFLADQAEGRAFLQWARAHDRLDFPVRWPTATG